MHETSAGYSNLGNASNQPIDRKPIDAAFRDTGMTLDTTITMLRDILSRLRGPRPETVEKGPAPGEAITVRAENIRQAAGTVQGLASEIAELI